MQSPAPVVKDLVLLGGGHSHVAVLKRFGMKPLPGVRLTLVSRDVHTPYSGMLPGLVAGHYEFDETHIDLQRLARFAGARLIAAEASGLDLANRRVLLGDRPSIAYDVLSINTGVTPGLDSVPGARENVTPVKPISRFWRRWRQVVDRTIDAAGRLRIGTVGAGAGGVELTLAMQYRLGNVLGRRGAAARPEFHIFQASAEILPTHAAGARRRMSRILAEREVAVHPNCRIGRVRADGVEAEDGRFFPLDLVLWTTQAAPPRWPAEAGLAVTDAGFIALNDRLQSLSHAEVFAAGDVATMVDHPREKAGVFAVRQGPPLADNLRRYLLRKPLKPFRPQKEFLTLISTGDRHAVGSRSFWSVEGDWVWQWKDRIDRAFMRKYSELPEMDERRPALPAGLASAETLAALESTPMRCAGCGGKVGAQTLERALARLEPHSRPDVVCGLADRDDAAAVAVPPGRLLVQSVDFFRAIVDDPFVFGKIAANHSLNDLFAKAAEPQTALAVAVTPFAAEEKVEEMLWQMLAGANEVLAAAGAALAGGHSSEGAELALGFAVSGLVDSERLLRKGGARPGDRLLLTKPLGTGTLFAAEMRGRAKGRWIQDAIESMLQSNAAAVGPLVEHGATASTDISGFGLAGHLIEMLQASGADCRLQLDSVPALEGAAETAAAGLLSSLQPDNLRLRRNVDAPEPLRGRSDFALLFDPQTAGGLLAAVPADRAEGCTEALQRAGFSRAAIVGEITGGPVGRLSLH